MYYIVAKRPLSKTKIIDGSIWGLFLGGSKDDERTVHSTDLKVQLMLAPRLRGRWRLGSAAARGAAVVMRAVCAVGRMWMAGAVNA